MKELFTDFELDYKVFDLRGNLKTIDFNKYDFKINACFYEKSQEEPLRAFFKKTFQVVG